MAVTHHDNQHIKPNKNFNAKDNINQKTRYVPFKKKGQSTWKKSNFNGGVECLNKAMI